MYYAYRKPLITILIIVIVITILTIGLLLWLDSCLVYVERAVLHNY